MDFEAKLADQRKDEKDLPIGTREPRTQNRAKIPKIRSATPPPRGSRPPKKKPGLSPIPPPLPSELHGTITVPTLPPLSSSTDEVAVTSSADVVSSTLVPPTAALSPAIVSPVSSSASTYPSPSMFPLPPADVPQADATQHDIAPSTDVTALTTIQASDSPATELSGDRVDARSSSASSDTVVEGRMDDIDKDPSVATGPTVDPPIIHVSIDLVKDSPLTSDVVEVLPSIADESIDVVRARDAPNSRNPSLTMSTTSVADLVADAYAHGIPPVDENSAEVMLLRADSPDLENLGLSAKDDQSIIEASSARVGSLLVPEGNKVLLRSDSNSSRTRSASDAVDKAAQVNRGNSLRHSRSAVQLGSKRVSDIRLSSLFEQDVPLPDRSLLAKRTRVPSVDARPLVLDAFVPGVPASGITRSRSAGGDLNGLSTWKVPPEWDVESISARNPSTLSVVSGPKPERPPRSHTPRIPSQVLTMRVSINSSESSSRPGSSRSSSSSEKLSHTKSLSAQTKESHPSPLIEKSMTSSQLVGVAVADEVVPTKSSLPVAVPNSHSLTPVSFGKLPPEPTFTNARTHRRSVSEKLTQSTISSLAKRERKRAPTPTLSERLPTRSASVEESVPSLPNMLTSSDSTNVLKPSVDEIPDHDALSSRVQARRAPTPIAPQGRPTPSADSPSSVTPDILSSKVPVRRAPTLSDRVAVPSTDMPLPPLPKPTGTTYSRPTLTHSPKASVNVRNGNEPSRRRAPTPTPSDRKRLPSDAPPVPSAVHLPSNVPQPVPLHAEEVRRTPTPTLLTRSRSGSIVNKDLPIPPVPSVPKVSSTPTHSPGTLIDYNSDDRARRAPTLSGSRPPLPSSNIPFPDPSVLARRYRKPSISRDAYSSISSSSTASGSEPSTRRLAQPTMSSVKPKQTSADPIRDRLASESFSYAASGSRSVGREEPPPLPPKAESRGRMRARPQSPVGSARARSVPRKVSEGGVLSEPPPVPSHGDERMRRSRSRPSSPPGERGRSSRSDADTRGSLHARSRSVGPASAGMTVKGRKRTSSLSVAPPPLPNHTLLPPSQSPLRALGPSQGVIRGRVSPFPMTPTSSSLPRPLSRALTSF
ncbi:hypothetical protein L218DRAFT_585759 [Marasmius fiardii PR-910]|nr:hypothetical protein L218DRAFT_585759 [Marasmius fiardii PR-910]